MDAPLVDESATVPQNPNNNRRWLVWLLGSLTTLAAAAVVLFLVFLVLQQNSVETQSLGCFYSLGGGNTTSSLIQQQISSSRCERALKKYTKKKGQYWKDIETALQSARKYLLERDNFIEPPYTTMVILDIDETSLSNLDHTKSAGFGHFDKDTWPQYLKTGTPPSIPGANTLFQDLRYKGFSVAFITGREEYARDGTEKALKAAGFGVKCTSSSPDPLDFCYEALIMRTKGPHQDAVTYKAAERQKLQAKFDIVASIGDQWSDLLGDPRPNGIFKMPNPFYYLP